MVAESVLHCRTELHFVRCIKPNNEQAQEDYDAALVLHQLRCCGITEVARIARAGYPTRYAHQQFAQRYSSLLGNRVPRKALNSSAKTCCMLLWYLVILPRKTACRLVLQDSWKPGILCYQSSMPCAEGKYVLAGWGEPVLETCKQLLSKFGVKPEQYQIGRTKLFFRAGVLGQLEDAATRINK